jgi:hypothetical protein
MKYQWFILVMVIGSLYQCNDTKKKDYSNLLFALNYKTGGNCVSISKSNENGNTTYTAIGLNVPRNGCIESTFKKYSTNVEEAKLESDKYFNSMVFALDKYPDCSNMLSLAVTNRELNSVASIQAGADASSTGCIEISNKFVYCKNEASITADRNNYKYVSVSDVKADMRENYESIVTINHAINQAEALGYEASIGNLRLADTTELSLFSGSDSVASLNTFLLNKACLSKIVLGNSNLKLAYSKIPTIQSVFDYEITRANRRVLTETIIPNLQCRYGDEISALPATVNSPAIGVCPASYPRW